MRRLASLPSPLVLLLPAVGVLAACTRDAGITKHNSEPEAQVTAPADGSTLLEGTAVILRGAASDPNHDAAELSARWFVEDVEVCAAAVPAADGTTTCDVVVPESDMLDVRLEVVDPDGAAAVANATYVVTPNAAPTAEIASPVADGVYYADQLVTFRGVVADAEDEVGALVVWWEDTGTRLDAVDATPTSEGEVLGYAALAEGPHALELHVLDTVGNEGVASVIVDVGPPNSAPDCAITAPASGGVSEVGARVDFAAQVSDVDVPAGSLAVEWSSDKDGVLGSSTPDSSGAVSFRTAALSAEDHRITLTVTDEIGAICTAGIDWTVATPPTISLESPLAGEVANEGEPISFVALVSDGEDVPGDLWVTWESSLDGVFHEGPPDSTGLAQWLDSGLSSGDHTLVVTVTDTAGLYATALGEFSVNGAPGAPGITLTPAAPDTADDLVAVVSVAAVDPEGDALTYAYAWSVDGTPSSASTSATLPASATTAGQVWTVDVSASDGLASGPAGSASVTIGNTAPVVTASLTPSSPNRASTLTCGGTYTDVDGDAVALSFGWTVDGVGVAASSTGAASSTLASGFGAGQTVACTVSGVDGSGGTDTDTASVTIGNSAPAVAGVSLSPTTAYTDDTLTASVSSSDADGDVLTYTYDWYVDGALVQSGASATLDGVVHFGRDQEVQVEVTVDDGADTAVLASDVLVVSNTPPGAPTVAISPSDATAGDELTCSVVTGSVDADGDTIVYDFAWDVDGVDHGSATDAASSSVVDGGDVGADELWTCTVIASDGADEATASASVGTSCLIGSEAACAGDSCLDILTNGGSVGSGTYWIDPYATGAFEVYCDMSTDGGGWTLGFVKNSVDTDTYQDFGSAVEDAAHLSVSPTVASASSSAYGGWLDLNTLSFTELRLRAYGGGAQTYESNSILKSDLRIRFGQNGYFLYNDRNGYYWCAGDYAYTDSGVGQVNRPSGAPADCKSHGSLGSGWDFSHTDTTNDGLTLCGYDYSRWMHSGYDGTWYTYPSVGAAQAIFVR